MSENGQGLGRAVLPGQLIPIGYCLGVSPEEKDCGFGEGPLQMGITDLFTRGAGDLPCRFFGTLHKPAV